MKRVRNGVTVCHRRAWRDWNPISRSQGTAVVGDGCHSGRRSLEMAVVGDDGRSGRRSLGMAVFGGGGRWGWRSFRWVVIAIIELVEIHTHESLAIIRFAVRENRCTVR